MLDVLQTTIPIRESLQPYLGQRLTFVGCIDKHGFSCIHILVSPVLLNGEVISDHCWLRIRKITDPVWSFSIGAWIQFNATVKEYVRLWPPNEGTRDYGLYRPRAICIVEH